MRAGVTTKAEGIQAENRQVGGLAPGPRGQRERTPTHR